MTDKENFDNFFDFDNKQEQFNSFNDEDEGNEQQIVQTFFDSFMASAGWRNIVSFLLNILALYFAIKGTLYCWNFTAPNITIFWLITFGYFIAAVISAGFALRLTVTKVCPNCYENRAIIEETVSTGNIERLADIRHVEGGKPWEQEKLVREEHVHVIKCKYCNYYEESEPFFEENWEKI